MCVQTNMLALRSARITESLQGHKCFLGLYMVSGLSGSLLSFLLSKSPSVGASGAIMGVFGGLFVTLGDNYQYFGKAAEEIRQSLLSSVVLTLGLGFVFPLLDQWYAPQLTLSFLCFSLDCFTHVQRTTAEFETNKQTNKTRPEKKKTKNNSKVYDERPGRHIKGLLKSSHSVEFDFNLHCFAECW
jgi:hypothetical protein